MSESSSVKVWFNDHAYKTYTIKGRKQGEEKTTCGELRGLCAEELHIPTSIRSCFALYALVNGKAQEQLSDDMFVQDVRRKYASPSPSSTSSSSPPSLSPSAWGESSADALAYRVREDASKRMGEEGGKESASHPPSSSPSSQPAPPAALPSSLPSSLPPLQQHQKRGIGHQRSRSSPAVSTSELAQRLAMLEKGDTVKLSSPSPSLFLPPLSLPSPSPATLPSSSSPSALSLSPRGGTPNKPYTSHEGGGRGEGGGGGSILPHHQEKRSLTPTPSREQLEEKDEAKAVGSQAPHLEPRASSSPPRSTTRARSKTISSSPFIGNNRTSSASSSSSSSSPTPLSLSSSSISKPSPSTSTSPALPFDEAALTMKVAGGSLGRSSARARTKRSSLNMGSFSTSTNTPPPTSSTPTRGRTSTSPPLLDSNTPSSSSSSASSSNMIVRGRTSTSPPPPRQRYTPPPTVLAPMIATLHHHALGGGGGVGGGVSHSAPSSTPASAPAPQRQRAHTLGAKMVVAPNWTKSDTTSKTRENPADSNKKLESVQEEQHLHPHQQHQHHDEKYLNELLNNTVHRLRKES